ALAGGDHSSHGYEHLREQRLSALDQGEQEERPSLPPCALACVEVHAAVLRQERRHLAANVCAIPLVEVEELVELVVAGRAGVRRDEALREICAAEAPQIHGEKCDVRADVRVPG